MTHEETFVLLALYEEENPVLILKSSKEDCEAKLAKLKQLSEDYQAMLTEVRVNMANKTAEQLNMTKTLEYMDYQNEMNRKRKEAYAKLKEDNPEAYKAYYTIGYVIL